MERKAAKQPPSIEWLRARLRLDTETGKLYWLDSLTGRGFKQRAGKEAGTPHKAYLRINFPKNEQYAHRVVFALHHGRWPENEIDHINGLGTDNRPCNLREATHQQNSMNRRVRRDNTTGIAGVTRAPRGKWQVRVGKDKHVGIFNDFEAARTAAIEAKQSHYGEFARTE